MPVTILGIESSCDDTGAAVIRDGKILSNIIADQSVHQAFGGVVPELASRAHMANIVPTVTLALNKAQINLNDLQAIAFTQGPGLLGSLMVGASYAKGLSLALGIPLIAVDHMMAHILAHFIEEPVPQFPFLCLTVSGGHTQIVVVKDYLAMQVIGQTIDDAAGEAFDKTAKMLGFQYPGGPLIDAHAKNGNPKAFKFNEPRILGLDFSFSGLKTSVLYFLRDRMKTDPNFIENNLDDLCASIQFTISSILLKKVEQAVRETGITQIALAGGVSANSGLRETFAQKGIESGWQVFVPQLQYCTDNAAMIAITGYYKYLSGQFADKNIAPLARMNSFL